MAKGNLFLGQGRGKVGDIVFYRQDGEQVTRTRNRHPRNPNTEPQMYQRAIMGTVTAAYKAGREIFDHSFQGMSVGAANQRVFLSRNAKLLRSLIASDLDNGRVGAATSGRVMAPGTSSPVGFPGMIISAGNYPMAGFVFSRPDSQASDPARWALPAAVADETKAAYAARVGLIADDIFTFCMFYYDSVTDPVLFAVRGVTGQAGAIQYRQHFAFLRLRVRADFTSSTEAVTGTTLAGVFYFDTFSPDIAVDELAAQGFAEELTLDSIVTAPGGAMGYIGLIRSRLDADLRSDSALWWGLPSGYSGISSEYILAAWSQGTESVGNSELILEGGGF